VSKILFGARYVLKMKKKGFWIRRKKENRANEGALPLNTVFEGPIHRTP